MVCQIRYQLGADWARYEPDFSAGMHWCRANVTFSFYVHHSVTPQASLQMMQ